MVALSHVIVALIAWIVGLGAYILALQLAWQQSMSFLSLISLVASSAVVWGLAYPCLYRPILLRLAPTVPRLARFCVLPLVALPLGFATVVLEWLSIIFRAALFGYGWPPLSSLGFFASPEASLFYWFFGASSIVVGLAFASQQSPKPSNHAMQRTAPRPDV
jgi:hypothetical protein